MGAPIAVANSIENRLRNLETRADSLEVNRCELARRIREVEKWIDTVSSPLWKRLWWWLCGWRFRRLGRWR